MTGAKAKGLRSYHAGLAAEDQVCRHYERGGAVLLAKRWRGAQGEIDLILREGDQIVFVEVKHSKTHDLAALHLSPAQVARIYSVAAEFVETQPLGQLTEVRLDAALVNGAGEIEIIRNFAA